jgi:hypothetical protein
VQGHALLLRIELAPWQSQDAKYWQYPNIGKHPRQICSGPECGSQSCQFLGNIPRILAFLWIG